MKIFNHPVKYHTAGFLLCLVLLLCGCADRKIPSVSVEMITLGTENGEDIKIPRFMTADGSAFDPVDDLNDQVKDLENLYLSCGADPDHSFYMRSYPASANDDYLQVTIYTRESYGTVTEENLTSLVYDREGGLILTPQDALEMARLSGVDVTSAVGKAYPGFREGEEELRSTEVQGFYIDEKGKVAHIYVKLLIDTEESDLYPEGTRHLFCIYHTESGEVTRFPLN